MYADDTTMYTALDTKLLSKKLKHITDWFKVKKLALSNQKTKYMKFTVPRIGENKLEIVTQFNFLVIPLPDCLRYNSYSGPHGTLHNMTI